jgi:glycosyltransferase involved in cell wall biosynthesis
MVVMPAYNAARTLVSTHEAIPSDAVGEVLLVDDGSTDETIDVARTLPIKIISLPHNVGYGGNQKVCYLEALRREADVVVMLHPDGQYDPAVIPASSHRYSTGPRTWCWGAGCFYRARQGAAGCPSTATWQTSCSRRSKMRHWGRPLHTGYRAYSQSFLAAVPFLSNNFVIDTQLIAQAVAFSQKFAEVPIRTRYHPEASSTSLKANLGYGCATLFTMLRWRLHKAGIVKCKLFMR